MDNTEDLLFARAFAAARKWVAGGRGFMSVNDWDALLEYARVMLLEIEDEDRE